MIKNVSITCCMYVVILLTATLVSACNYTRLARMEPRPTEYGLLPDLSVRHVNASLRHVRLMDAPEKEISVTFQVRIMNTGDTSFHETLFIGWIDRPHHIQPTVYDHLGPVTPCTLAPGDSIDLTESWSYPIDQPTTAVKLIVLTDERSIRQNDAQIYHCGAFPVQEERYDNNESFTILYPDSIRNE